VRKRVVSYGPPSVTGAQAWETLQTILGTAKKPGVNFFHYLRDRIGGACQMPSLADLIQQRALPYLVCRDPRWSRRSGR